eukprot:Tbor_TRINITY_DN5776_c2_g2::TRINITY_DN5776_c2_g2_i7::g.20789::m.20789
MQQYHQLAKMNNSNNITNYSNYGINKSYSQSYDNNGGWKMTIDTSELPPGHTEFPNNVRVYKSRDGDSVDVSVDYPSGGSSPCSSSNVNVSMSQTSPYTRSCSPSSNFNFATTVSLGDMTEYTDIKVVVDM